MIKTDSLSDKAAFAVSQYRAKACDLTRNPAERLKITIISEVTYAVILAFSVFEFSSMFVMGIVTGCMATDLSKECLKQAGNALLISVCCLGAILTFSSV